MVCKILFKVSFFSLLFSYLLSIWATVSLIIGRKWRFRTSSVFLSETLSFLCMTLSDFFFFCKAAVVWPQWCMSLFERRTGPLPPPLPFKKEDIEVEKWLCQYSARTSIAVPHRHHRHAQLLVSWVELDPVKLISVKDHKANLKIKYSGNFLKTSVLLNYASCRKMYETEIMLT